MNISISIPHTLSQKQVEEIFNRRLEELMDGQWIISNDVFEEFVTSHRFDSKVGTIDEPRFALLVAVTNLQKILEDRKKR